MALKHIDGFDQFQGQSSQALLSSLTSAGYAVTSGMGVASGRKPSSFALELQVSPGAGGASWSARTNSIKADLHGVAMNPQGRFVAVGDGGLATTSVDGIQWANLVLGVGKNMKSIECVAGTFIAVGDGGAILRSTDGQVWSERVAPNGATTLNDVAFGNGRWLAVGGAGSSGVIFISDDDGLTWSSVTENPGLAANYSVAYGDGMWVVGGQGGQIITSPTGDAFTTRAFGSSNTVYGLAVYNGTWLALNGGGIRRSNDKGATWATAAVNLMTSGVLRAIDVADGRWIAGGEFGALYMSDDTTTWSKPAFTGVGTATVYDINASFAVRAGWCLVGAKIGSTTTSTAMIYVSLAPPTTISRTFTSAQNRVVIGFAHRATARGRIFSVKNLLDMDWPAGIEILGERGASVPIRNTWYYYELVLDKTAKTVSLYVNNMFDLTAPMPAGGETMTEFALTWQAENGAVALIDDVYLLDADTGGGSTMLNRLGPISIPIRMPTADKNLEWDGSIDGPHWSLVGLLPPSSASYIRSSTSGEQDLFTSNTPLPTGAGSEQAPILAVGIIALAQKSDLDNRQLGLVIGEPGNQKEVIDTVLSTTTEYSFAVFEQAPGNIPWTADKVLSTPFGVAVRP